MYIKDDLLRLNMNEIVQIAKSMSIKLSYSEKGKQMKYKKGELIELILENEKTSTVELVKKQKSEVVKEVKEVKKVSETKIIPFKKKLNKDDELIVFVNKYFEKIINYRVELNMKKILFSPSFFNIVSDFCSEIKQYTIDNSDTDTLNGNTLKNNISQILNRVENRLLDDDRTDNILVESFNNFCYSVKNNFKDEIGNVRKTTVRHLNERQKSIAYGKCLKLLETATNNLKFLPIKVERWKDVALSLMVVTGRRLTEIMFSASFEVVDEYHVKFWGQLKGSGYDDDYFVIPTLCNSEYVVNGLKWLDNFNRRNKTNFLLLVKEENEAIIKEQSKLTHGRYARYLNEYCKKFLPQNIDIDANFWTINFDDGKQKSRATTHMLRQLYAQIAYYVFYFSEKTPMKKHQILAEILGHEYDEHKPRTASQNYDADIEIDDLMVIKDYIYSN